MSKVDTKPKPLLFPMIVRHFRPIAIDKNGYEVRRHKDQALRWFPILSIAGRKLAVYEFELYFADSYTLYNKEYIRARDNRQAKQKIRQLYPNVIKFQFDDTFV